MCRIIHAAELSASEPGTAAISSIICSELYGLNVFERIKMVIHTSIHTFIYYYMFIHVASTIFSYMN